jgi:hypothetical protein
MVRMLGRLQSPRLTPESRRTALYPYYAGFSERFVESVLWRVGAKEGQCVLDPWNGSGTTTAVCATLGLNSIGIDLNPAMKPVAAVRAMGCDQILAAVDAVLSLLAETEPPNDPVSPFQYCAALCSATKLRLNDASLDVVRLGLMATCRRIARQLRSKNPTWYSAALLRSLRVDGALIHATIQDSFRSLAEARPISVRALPQLLVGDWNMIHIRQPVSHVISSPPYLTRIDYVMKTLPELLFLSNEKRIDLPALRRSMMGGVLTAPSSYDANLVSPLARDCLIAIHAHSSKASATYYHRFFHKYFVDLQNALRKICALQPHPKTITLVTRGSYYKEAFINLPEIISQILKSYGYGLTSGADFPPSNGIVWVNTRSIASNSLIPAETAATYVRT